VAAALRTRPNGTRWCAQESAAKAAEARRFNSCISQNEVRYYCRGAAASALELELPDGGGVFAAMRATITEAFTRAAIILTPLASSSATPTNTSVNTLPPPPSRQPRLFFWGDSHTRLLHQTMKCLWPKVP
jgi:hypothetical protein